jgi:membrane-associated phospholipid phosphatase
MVCKEIAGEISTKSASLIEKTEHELRIFTRTGEKKAMYNATNPEGMQTQTTATMLSGEKRESRIKRHPVIAFFWAIALLIFIVSCFIFRTHPQPFPFDLAVTQSLTPLQDVRWVNTILQIPTFMNDTYTAIAMVTVLFVALLLIGEIRRRRGKSAILWFESAIFLAVFVPLSTFINIFIANLVNRPRPSSLTSPIKYHTQLILIPSFPSGHTEHSVVFYGFLLFLSFIKPVREWRYRWVLIPFQVYAVLDILTIGFSRIVAEDHWISDVLGGYLVGALELCVYIFLFWWIYDILTKRRAKRLLEKSTQEMRHVD